jgi:FMN phosphatase YigB (HAD superfamily)
MAKKCKTPGRNLCTPSGKIAALFIDLDGTVVECEPYFESARERFGFLMQLCGFDKKHAIATLKAVDLANSQTLGFDREKFPMSLVEAYSKLCKENGRRRRREVIEMCEDIGNSPYFRDPKVFRHAAAVLNRARHNFYLVVVTMGNREVQKHKIRQGGLDSIFDELIITPTGNKAERVRELIEDLDIDPRYSAFIGNSCRSDGPTLTQTNFIHMPLEGWEYDEAELPTGTGFESFTVTDWRDAEERALARLLRRRDNTLLDPASPDCGCK